ncbi:MAG: lactonase family protein, partial [Lentisphaerae bacterium]
ALSEVRHEGRGVNSKRQEAPHAHAAVPSQTRCGFWVTDLGTDTVTFYGVEKRSRQVKKGQQLRVKPGSGPRHLIFHPQAPAAFLVNELSSTLIFLHYARQAERLTPLAEYPLLPASFTGENIAADVRISPCGRWVVASNRGHESVAVFAFDQASFTLTPAGIYACGGLHPRNIAFDPSGRYLLVANQNSHRIVALALDPACGSLIHSGVELEVPMPVCILFH